MERLTRIPASVYGFFTVAFYLTALGYVFEARGRTTATAVSTLVAYLFAALIVRAALKPAR